MEVSEAVWPSGYGACLKFKVHLMSGSVTCSKGLYTREKVVTDNLLVMNNKILSTTKHRLGESSYQLQIVQNKAVDDKVVFCLSTVLLSATPFFPS